MRLPTAYLDFGALQRLCRRDDKLHGEGLISKEPQAAICSPNNQRPLMALGGR
jgi:hypothetical protein